jgi:serine/threonine protein kinase
MTDVVISQSATPSIDRDGLDRDKSSALETAGEVLTDRYVIRSLLGRGGFGITFLARNIHLPGEPLCVIKKLAPQFTDPSQIEIARQQFDLEAFSLSRLGSHAQIPTLLDYFTIGSDCYLVEEYIPGVVLTKVIQEQHKFTDSEVENFLNQMLRLLEYIHSHHLIHRDIKPENIILCQTDRRFVLVDFGAVKDIAPVTTAGERTDVSSSSIGTPGFAPPEQLANRAVYASDLYALGMTCVYLLTGKEPSQFPTDPHTCELMWSDAVEISPELGETIGKMMQIPLVDRYQSAAQVLTALENLEIRAKLRKYLDRKHAVSKSQWSGDRIYYPAVIHRALGIG